MTSSRSQRGLLGGGVGQLEHAALEQLLHRLGIGRVDAAHLLLDPLLDPLDVDLDALGVRRDRADQVVAQPGDAGEEPLVGGLAQREVEEHVLLGDVEPRGEGGDVRGHQRGLAGRGQRDADVGDGQHLAGQGAETRADLVGEQHPDRPPRMPRIGPACACASSGSAVPSAPTDGAATGSTSTFHTSVVPTTHSARLHAAAVVTPEGNSVVSSSQWSASRTASATAFLLLRRATGRGLGDGLAGQCRARRPS